MADTIPNSSSQSERAKNTVNPLVCYILISEIKNVTTTETQHSIQLRTCRGEHQPIFVTFKWRRINIDYYKYKYYVAGVLFEAECRT